MYGHTYIYSKNKVYADCINMYIFIIPVFLLNLSSYHQVDDSVCMCVYISLFVLL